MIKPKIQNWHREEFAEGFLDNIPADIIELLKAEKAARDEVEKKAFPAFKIVKKADSDE